MKRVFKRVLAVFLCLVMLGGAAPAAGFAHWFTMQASAKTITEYSRGDIIEFGWYPQSEVMDSIILSQLNAQAPAWGNWTSYGYYSGTGWEDGQMKSGDYMRYTDILLDGVKYRGVKFTAYRPGWTRSTSSKKNSNQYDNAYYTNAVYWFRFDPLRWRVLDPDAGLVLCETIVDSQAFNNYVLKSGKDEYGYTAYWGNAEKTYYANNYAKSSIRKWLNSDFYNTAFSAKQQAKIHLTQLDNKAYSASYSAYDAKSTNDKIFLLSYSDAMNTLYGFSPNSTEDTARRAEGSDYAKCQGLYASTSGSDRGYSCWRLRSPSYSSFKSCPVFTDGVVHYECPTDYTGHGVRPALRLHLYYFDKSETAIKCSCCDEVCYLSSKKNFEYGRDNFSFEHKNIASYDISDVGLKYVNPFLEKDLIALSCNYLSRGFNYIDNKIKGNGYGTWGGSCYGMACMDASFLSTLDTSKYGSSTVYGLKLDTKLKDSINIMLYSQASILSVMNQVGNSLKNKNQTAVSAAKSISSNSYLPVIRFQYKERKVSHAVNIIGILPDDADPDYYVLSIYDCNRVNEPELIIIKKDFEKAYIGHFNFDPNSSINTIDEEIEIVAVLTGTLNNIDFWAPGLSASTEYSASRSVVKNTSNELDMSSQYDEFQSFAKEYIRFLLASDGELAVTAEDGSSFVYKNGEVTETNIDNIYCETLGDLGVTKVVIPYTASSYKFSSNEQYYANIGYDDKIAVVYCEKGGVSAFESDGIVSVDTSSTKSYAEVSCYKDNMIEDSDALGILISNSSSNTKVDFSQDNPVVESNNIEEMNLKVQHDDKKVSIEEIELTTYGNIDKFEITASVLAKRVVKSITLANAVVQYKSALTLTPAIEADEGAAYTVAFTSSNPKIAEVDKDGKITTHKKGTVTITCTVTNSGDPTNKAETTCKVTVKYAWWQWLIRILLLGFLWY